MGFACCKSYWYPLVDRLLEWGARDWTGTAAAAPAAAQTGSAGTTPQQPPRHHGPQQRATSSAAGSANTASTSSGIPGAVPVSPASRSGSRYQICCFDSRGFGLSGDSLARYSSSSMARDMTALLMHLGWVHPSRAELARDLAMHRVRERAQAALEQAESEGRWDSCFQPPPLHIVGWSMGQTNKTSNWSSRLRGTAENALRLTRPLSPLSFGPPRARAQAACAPPSSPSPSPSAPCPRRKCVRRTRRPWRTCARW